MPKAAPQRPVILAVDDSADLLALMSKALGADYQVLTAEEGASGVKLALGKPRPDLILLDIEMPGLSGFEVCRMLKANHESADIPVIFLTGKAEKQAEVEGLQLGAVDYVTKPINSAVLKVRVRAHVALANQRHELERLVQERTAQLESTRVELIQRLGRAMQFHESSAVGNRVLRLGHYAKLLSQAAGAKPLVCDMMFKAAPLHDVGKLGVPSEVLRKKEKLSAPDWEQMKRHPQLGADIIGEQRDPLLQLARQLALTHHEHWDGSGYPQGLKGDAIPWPGRVMAVVDSFESMTTTQFYRDTPLPVERAAAEIVRDAGKRYDPAVVTAFKKALPAMTKVREAYADALGDLINLDFSAPRRAAKGAPGAPQIDFPVPGPEGGRAEALEAKLKALESELAQAKQAALAEARKEKPAAAPQGPDPALAETRDKLAVAEQKLAAAEQGLAAAEQKLADAQKAAAAREKPEGADALKRLDAALGETRAKLATAEEKLTREAEARLAAEAERSRLEGALADAVQNLATEKKLGELGVADAAHERQRLEGALKREADMRAEGERRSAELAVVRKRIDAALDEARGKLVAAEEKLTRESAARLEAQQALEDAREQALRTEEKAKGAAAAAARVEGERRSAEMAEVRKRIDAVLREARERVAAAEEKLKHELEAKAEAERRASQAADAKKQPDPALGEARTRLAAIEEQLKREIAARAAAEEKLKGEGTAHRAALEIGKREAHAVEEGRKRLAALEEQLKRESEARTAAERRAAALEQKLVAEEKEERSSADSSAGISRQGLAAARRALGRPKEKSGK